MSRSTKQRQKAVEIKDIPHERHLKLKSLENLSNHSFIVKLMLWCVEFFTRLDNREKYMGKGYSARFEIKMSFGKISSTAMGETFVNLLFCHAEIYMMTTSNENIFRVTGPLCGEFTAQRAVNSPHKGQWRGALMFSLICAWINVWVNNGEAGDLRRHRAHYDVIVMSIFFSDNFDKSDIYTSCFPHTCDKK